jgi:hypothetical protein
MSNNGPLILAATGIVCITILECVALYTGVDGQILSVVVGTIATITGYAFGVTKTPSK